MSDASVGGFAFAALGFGRRLSRRGHARAFDAPPGGWAETGSCAPRAGSQVEFLVDGAEVLPRMVEDISAAESHVQVAGWFFTPTFEMGHGGPTLRGLLADAALRVDVRVLAWAGAPLPLFHPDRGEVRELRDELTRGTRIQMQLDSRERPMHCHHEKIVLVDDRVAYVGGIDLTSLAGNRLDSSSHEHRLGIGWHDACHSELVAYGAAPVGSLKPNPWGVFDMHGNAWEWVEDCWTPNPLEIPLDGSAFSRPGNCEIGVMRGGSFSSSSLMVRSAIRTPMRTAQHYFNTGLRVALTLGD